MAAPQASPTLSQFRTGLVPAPGTATGQVLTDGGWSQVLTINPLTGQVALAEGMTVSSGNVTVASGNLNIVSGQLQLNGVSQFQTGTFTGTITGVTTTVTGTVTYVIEGKTCTLSAPAGMSGTSNSTAMTMTGVPAACQPATQSQVVPCSLEDNGANTAGAAQVVAVSSTITFFRSVVSGTAATLSASGFTASAAKGLNETSFTYSLA